MDRVDLYLPGFSSTRYPSRPSPAPLGRGGPLVKPGLVVHLCTTCWAKMSALSTLDEFTVVFASNPCILPCWLVGEVWDTRGRQYRCCCYRVSDPGYYQTKSSPYGFGSKCPFFFPVVETTAIRTNGAFAKEIMTFFSTLVRVLRENPE